MARAHGRASTQAAVPSTIEQFFELLERVGGELRILSPTGEVRAAWRRLIHAAKLSESMPPGWYLLHRGRDHGDLVIEMRPGVHPSGKYRKGDAHPLPRPDVLTDPHPVVAALRDDDDRLPASPDNRGRAVMMAQAIADEAARRNLTVRRGDDGLLVEVVADDLAYGLRVTEETGARWTVRLLLELTGPGMTEPLRWADHAKRRVEDDLGLVLDEIVGRADAVRREVEEREQRAARERAERQANALREQRAKILRRQVTAWQQALLIRRYCEELVAAGMVPGDEWLRWVQARADEIDPLLDPPGMADLADADVSDDEPVRVTPSPFAGFRAELPKPWHPNRGWWDR